MIQPITTREVRSPSPVEQRLVDYLLHRFDRIAADVTTRIVKKLPTDLTPEQHHRFARIVRGELGKLRSVLRR